MHDITQARQRTDFLALIPSEPRLEQRAIQPYVAIEAQAPLHDRAPVAALIPEVLAWMRERRIPTVGAPFFRYWIVGDGDRSLGLEVGVPVPQIVAGDDRVHAGLIPAGRYAVLTHRGHPNDIGHSIHVLEEWGAQHGVAWQMNEWDVGQKVWGGRFEFHVTDTAPRSDPTRWTTEIAYLVRESAAKATYLSIVTP